MTTLIPVTAAATAFVGSHLVLSQWLRRPIAGVLGERGFMLAYSAVAVATIAWLSVAYQAAPGGPSLWRVGPGLWAAVTVVMLLAAVLLVGSLVRNPAMPNATAAPVAATGVFAITRHPMMWSFALWSLCHAAIYPIAANLVLTAAIAVLALGGAALQDRKKAAALPGLWPGWQAKTSFWPFAAIAAGRARLAGFGGHALGGGLVVWLAATWAHGPIAGWRVGIWHWIG